MHVRALTSVVVVGAILSLTGCGGDDDDQSTGRDAGDRTAVPADDPPAAGRDQPATDPAGATTKRNSEPADRDDAPPAAPSTPSAGLPPKQQRQEAADRVCRAKDMAEGSAALRLGRVCTALRRAARADTLSEYRRALQAAAAPG